MLDAQITLLETCHFQVAQPYGGVFFSFGNRALNSEWSLIYDIVERAATRFNIYCMFDKMFDRNQNILSRKNIEQTSSNMHATRSNLLLQKMNEIYPIITWDTMHTTL